MTAVRLREVRASDLEDFFRDQLDPEATRLAAVPARDRASFEAHWARILADSTVVARTILYQGQVAGNVVLWLRDGLPHVGYWITRALWGRGIASQALAAFLPGIAARPVFARVAPHNPGSIRVLEKCGFVPRSAGAGPRAEPDELLMELP